MIALLTMNNIIVFLPNEILEIIFSFYNELKLRIRTLSKYFNKSYLYGRILLVRYNILYFKDIGYNAKKIPGTFKLLDNDHGKKCLLRSESTLPKYRKIQSFPFTSNYCNYCVHSSFEQISIYSKDKADYGYAKFYLPVEIVSLICSFDVMLLLDARTLSKQYYEYISQTLKNLVFVKDQVKNRRAKK